MSKKDVYIYPAKFIYEDGQEIAIVFPDLDLATSGIDDADALASAKEALESRLRLMKKDGDITPEPTPISKVSVAGNEKVVLIKANLNLS